MERTASTMDATPAPVPTHAQGKPKPPRGIPNPRPPLPGTALRGGEASIVVATSRPELEPYLADWEDLAGNALEPNLFCEQWMLLPAMEAFGRERRIEITLVFGYDVHPRERRHLLLAVLPLESRSRYGPIPIRHLTVWKHDYAFLGGPLLRRGRASEALDAFFDASAERRRGPHWVEFGGLPGDGLVHQELIDAVRRRGAVACAPLRANRAFFRPAADAEAYVRRAIDGARRKKLRWMERRLGESGRITYEELRTDGPVQEWLAEFLRLEAGGWKGRAGTALASKEADRRYVETVVAEAFRRGRLMMTAMRLDGRTIAMKMNFLAEGGGFMFKIAFDEGMSAHSPGTLLEIEHIQRLHARPGLEWFDSCADPDHPMINRLWTERRPIEDLFVGTGSLRGSLFVASLPLARLVKSLLRPRTSERRA